MGPHFLRVIRTILGHCILRTQNMNTIYFQVIIYYAMHDLQERNVMQVDWHMFSRSYQQQGNLVASLFLTGWG